MSIGTKCWPSKGASYVGSSRYATISLAIEVVQPPPPPLFSSPLCMHYLPHPCSHPQRHPDGGVTFIPHVALSSVLSLITSVCDTRLATPHSPLDLFNFCHLLHFNSPQRVMSFSTHPNASQKGAGVKRGRGQFAFRRAAATFHSSNCAAQNKS